MLLVARISYLEFLPVYAHGMGGVFCHAHILSNANVCRHISVSFKYDQTP